MVKRIMAIVFIFAATTSAWVILGTTIFARTRNFGSSLKSSVSTIWGSEQKQEPPAAFYVRPSTTTVDQQKNGNIVKRKVETADQIAIPLEQTRADVKFDLDYRQKGLIWYSTYKVDFQGQYSFLNNSTKQEEVTIRFPLPAETAVYDNFRVLVDGKPMDPKIGGGSAEVQSVVPAGARIQYVVTYRSQGMDNWRYVFGGHVEKVRNFTLKMQTNFSEIDYPENTLSPTQKTQNSSGWELQWHYDDLLSGFQIGMDMPQKLQPGELAGTISFFAPVSLFFFFFIIFIVTTLRGIDLHPMNYFFLAAAFFAFHLLLAYTVDHISIHLAFIVCSAVSMTLVITYLRLAVEMKFAFEAGLAQFVYLVLFSYAFFFKGFTGLAITIGSIVTLFVLMQMTGRINWTERFERKAAKEQRLASA